MSINSKPRHKVWLHIGIPKTGTTSIQTVCFYNRKILLDHGYFYPDFGDIQHQALVRKLAKRAGSTIDFSFPGSCGSFQRFTDYLKQSDGQGSHTSIISSELFFQRPGGIPGIPGKPGVNGFSVLKKTIAEAARYFDGCDVTVLIYLRRQDNWLMSIYNETVKISNYSESFEKFSELTLGTRFFRIVQMWIEYFGRDKVICHSYDALIKNRCNSVNHFLETVCPDVPAASLNLAENQKNPGLSNEALWLKQLINTCTTEINRQQPRKLRNHILRTLTEITRSSLEPGRPMLSNAERRTLMEEFLPGNHRLIKELGYRELQALIDLSDLEPQTDTAEQLSTPPHETYRLAVEKMIKSLL